MRILYFPIKKIYRDLCRVNKVYCFICLLENECQGHRFEKVGMRVELSGLRILRDGIGRITRGSRLLKL